MSEEIEVQQDEIQEIKSRLDQMGVKYHHNAKIDTLRALLAKSLKGDEVVEDGDFRLSSLGDDRYSFVYVSHGVTSHPPDHGAPAPGSTSESPCAHPARAVRRVPDWPP